MGMGIARVAVRKKEKDATDARKEKDVTAPWKKGKAAARKKEKDATAAWKKEKDAAAARKLGAAAAPMKKTWLHNRGRTPVELVDDL